MCGEASTIALFAFSLIAMAFGYALYLYIGSTTFASELDCCIYWWQMASTILAGSGSIDELETKGARVLVRFVAAVSNLDLSGGGSG